MKRRKILLEICSIILLISGWLSNSSTVPGVTQITISVHADIEFPVELVVRKEGTIVHDEEYDVSTDRINLTNESWMGDTVNYELIVSLPDGREEIVTTEDLGERFDLTEHGCFGVNFHVSNDEGITTYVTDRPCDYPD
jgi:hypothetical protein